MQTAYAPSIVTRIADAYLRTHEHGRTDGRTNGEAHARGSKNFPQRYAHTHIPEISASRPLPRHAKESL